MTYQLKWPKQGWVKAETAIALLLLLVANIAISFAAIFIRLSENDIGPSATIFNRLAIATVIFSVWNAIIATNSQQSNQETEANKIHQIGDWLLLILVVSLFCGAQVFWAWSLTQTSATISNALHDFSPIFTSLGAWLSFRQRFDRRFTIGMVLAIGGAMAIGLEDWQSATIKLGGDALSLLSAILYGTYLLGLEKLRRKFSAVKLMLWVCVTGSMLTLAIASLTENSLFPSSWEGWLSVISLGVICQAIGQGLIMYSLKKLSSVLVALSGLLMPVLTAIWARMVFAEALTFSMWLAFAGILLGLYLAISSQSAVKT